jgi:puromycin-sensitive aminopeptidase
MTDENGIDGFFDDISYNKGASVIRMLVDYIGEDTFKQGLNLYLNRHQYGNATTADLWQALSEKSGSDLAAFMDAWVNRQGFPLLSLREHTHAEPHSDDEHDYYVVAQTAFGDGSATAAVDGACETWRVPVRVAALAHDNSLEEHFFLLEQPEQVLKLPRKENGYKHIKLNAGHKGYYRSTYSSPLADQLFANISRYERLLRASILEYTRCSSQRHSRQASRAANRPVGPV